MDGYELEKLELCFPGLKKVCFPSSLPLETNQTHMYWFNHGRGGWPLGHGCGRGLSALSCTLDGRSRQEGYYERWLPSQAGSQTSWWWLDFFFFLFGDGDT